MLSARRNRVATRSRAGKTEQDEQGRGDVERDQRVQQEGRQRYDHHDDDADDPDGDGKFADVAVLHGAFL
jgi:hypothetical protein